VAGGALWENARAGTRQDVEVRIDLEDPRFAALDQVGGAVKVTPRGSFEAIIVVRLAEDEFRAFSSTCPHFSCEVSLPDDDGIISCPCHDSTFDRQGRYIQGPAEADLRPVPLTVSPQTVVRDQTWGQVKKQR
jgi:Rieske Fe-S protein